MGEYFMNWTCYNGELLMCVCVCVCMCGCLFIIVIYRRVLKVGKTYSHVQKIGIINREYISTIHQGVIS